MLGTMSADISVIVFFRFFILKKVARVVGVSYGKIIRWLENGLILFVAFLSGIPLVFMKRALSSSPFISLVVTFIV